MNATSFCLLKLIPYIEPQKLYVMDIQNNIPVYVEKQQICVYHYVLSLYHGIA